VVIEYTDETPVLNKGERALTKYGPFTSTGPDAAFLEAGAGVEKVNLPEAREYED